MYRSLSLCHVLVKRYGITINLDEEIILDFEKVLKCDLYVLTAIHSLER